MSIKRQVEITCPVCGNKQYERIWSCLSSEDEMGMELLNYGYLNVYRCERCAYRSFIDEPVLYDDVEHRYCVQYVSRMAAQTKEFYCNIGTNGKQLMDERGLAGKGSYDYMMQPHYVFNLREIPPYIHFRKQCAAHGLDPAETYPELDPPPFLGSDNRLLSPEMKSFVSAQLQEAKRHLTEEQLIAFFRATQHWNGEDDPTDICDAWDAGYTLDDIFGWFERTQDPKIASPETGVVKVKLLVKRMADGIYSISFDFVGSEDEEVEEWLVAYDEHGAVRQCGLTNKWEE